MKETYVKKRFFTDERLSRLIRWWSVSAVYFFIGWGTGLGFQSTVIDFIFFLSIAIGIFDMFVVNPVIYNMFNVKNPMKLGEKSIWQRVRYRLLYFFKVFVIVGFVVITYDLINLTAIKVFAIAADRVFLPGEPIMFGVFYSIYYYLIKGIGDNLKRQVQEKE